jgi:hypothetical protein
MAPLKSVLLAGLASAFASSFSGDSCETGDQTGDQTALLQSHLSRKSDLSVAQLSAQSAALFPKLSSLNDPHTRKSALAEIQKTAIKLASMDRTEATDVVIEVCTDTAELLNTTVLHAIIEEDAADRAALEAAYAGFAEWESHRQAAEDALEAAEAIVSSKAQALATCRTVESETCVNETICSTETIDHCEERDRLERELREIDEEIHRAWCVEGGGAPEIRQTTSFRTTTVEIFHRYTEKWNALLGVQGQCEEVIEHCETTLATYIDKATECNTKESELWMSSCEYHHVASGALTAYQQGFQAALTFYNDVVARVMIEEADRKVEWDVLTRVICLLLTLTTEEDGVVSSDETAARIQRCWDDDVDVSHLDIDYLDPPDMLTLPDLPPLPCTAEHEDHYQTGPPAACTALIELHHTQSSSECSCLADQLSDQTLVLGHYLMVDPGIEMTAAGGQWTVTMDGETYGGQMSTIHTGTFTDLTANMLSDEQMQPLEDDGSANDAYTGPITSIAWAYPSQAATFDGAMSLAQRFASRGGMVFLNAEGQVIEVRELASSSGPLGQPVSATLSFSSAEEITDADVQAACPTGLQQVRESSRYYPLGAREYCWAMNAAVSQCNQGCFIYQLVDAKVVYPLIGGMHIAEGR